MEGEDTVVVSDPLLEVDKDSWEETTAQVIQSIEQRCSGREYSGSITQFGAQSFALKPWDLPRLVKTKKSRPKSDCFIAGSDNPTHLESSIGLLSKESTDNVPNAPLVVALQPCHPSEHTLESHSEDIRYIDDSAKSSLSTSLTEAPIPQSSPPPLSSVSAPPTGRSCASILEERYCHAFLCKKNDHIVESWAKSYTCQSNHGAHRPKRLKHDPRLVVSSLPPEKEKPERDTNQPYSETDYVSNTLEDSEQNSQDLPLERDFRYYFQHPYSRLFVSYFVIFCNFLVFAEDPISHSHTESEIPVVGNVFSFVATKYPIQWSWCVLKVFLWLMAILGGLICGKYIIHHLMLSRLFRLKMFRDEQGTWMIMFLTSLVFIYMFSLIYNSFVIPGHPPGEKFRINSFMGITNANFMKAAACGTWLGDFVTAWMVTDMMLQDNLYPGWAKPYRKFWRAHGRIRITIFWTGSVVMTALVVTLIVSDWISWDYLNRDFVATTELSRAFLASFILVMDLLIVMQDWDFPHFVCDLDIKLPGMHVASFKFNLFQKYVNIPDVVFHITGKWFNYSIIVFVMILDLNMWKNQIFYTPADYGQYTAPDHKVYTVTDLKVLATGNASMWTYEYRVNHIDPRTNRSLLEGDMSMNSRYLGYPLSVKGMAFVPSLIGFAMFGILTYLYGRFAAKSYLVSSGGRYRKRKRELPRSSWRRERGAQRTHYIIQNKDKRSEEKKKGVSQLTELIVAWDESKGSSVSCEKPL